MTRVSSEPQFEFYPSHRIILIFFANFSLRKCHGQYTPCNFCCYEGASSLKLRFFGCPGNTSVVFDDVLSGNGCNNLTSNGTINPTINSSVSFVDCDCFDDAIEVSSPSFGDIASCPLFDYEVFGRASPHVAASSFDLCLVSTTDNGNGHVANFSHALPEIIGLKHLPNGNSPYGDSVTFFETSCDENGVDSLGNFAFPLFPGYGKFAGTCPSTGFIDFENDDSRLPDDIVFLGQPPSTSFFYEFIDGTSVGFWPNIDVLSDAMIVGDELFFDPTFAGCDCFDCDLVESMIPLGLPSPIPSFDPMSPTDGTPRQPDYGTHEPTAGFTDVPSRRPSTISSFTVNPSSSPSFEPSFEPSIDLSFLQSEEPSGMPSPGPTMRPSSDPSEAPFRSFYPSIAPSDKPSVSTLPSVSPSTDPTIDSSMKPSLSSSDIPSEAPSGSFYPSIAPSDKPSVSAVPSVSPSTNPSEHHTEFPSKHPSPSPAEVYTFTPSESPTFEPITYRCPPTSAPIYSSGPVTPAPVEVTFAPYVPTTGIPSSFPTSFTTFSSQEPTEVLPTEFPTSVSTTSVSTQSRTDGGCVDETECFIFAVGHCVDRDTNTICIPHLNGGFRRYLEDQIHFHQAALAEELLVGQQHEK